MGKQRELKVLRTQSRLELFWLDLLRKCFGQGKSKSAGKRFERSMRGKLYTGKPGQVVKMSDREYYVAPDGSFRRMRPSGVLELKKAA